MSMRTAVRLTCVVAASVAAMPGCRHAGAPAPVAATPAISPPVPQPSAATDTVRAARERMVAEVLQQIAGRENEPAGQVFKNVKLLTRMPARQLLAVMNIGYGRSLGVTCAHCHVVGEWASEEKPQKQIAREMSKMAATINGELLKQIPNLRSPNPVVNCTTCHRGAVRPALDLSP